MNENRFLVTELEQLEDIRYLEASYLENFFEDGKIGRNIQFDCLPKQASSLHFLFLSFFLCFYTFKLLK